MPVLRRYGFKFWGCGTEIRGEELGATFVSGSHYIHNTAFRMDIFWSTINEQNKIVNVSDKGLYHKLKLDSDIFFPPRYSLFNGISLPFSNDVEQEVLLSYGDVNNTCIIYSHVLGADQVVYDNWKDAISDYDYLKSCAIQNTKDKFT